MQTASKSETPHGGGLKNLQSRPPSADTVIDFPRPVNAENARSARLAGRVNAANASQDEIDRLLAQRSNLLDKLFTKTITKAERNMLEYVRWHLDTIDDARNGAALDLLEMKLEAMERLSADIKHLHSQLSEVVLDRGGR